MHKEKKSVLITGAGRGLGLALTQVFLKEGWTVYALVRKEEDASNLKTANLQRCIPIISDVTSETVRIDIETALGNTGALDILTVLTPIASLKRPRICSPSASAGS